MNVSDSYHVLLTLAVHPVASALDDSFFCVLCDSMMSVTRK